MIRDTKKTPAFWEESLNSHKMEIERYEGILKSTIDDRKRARIQRCVYHEYLCLLVTQYSAGESYAVMKDSFSKCLKIMSDIWTPDNSYVEMLWMISIGVLLDVDDMDTQLLCKVYEQYGEDDAILSYLLRYFSPSFPGCEKLLFEHPYNVLLAATTKDGVDAKQMIMRYLKGWYKGHDDTWWYGTHQTDRYIGYWSFESAAIAKIMKLDVSDLADREFFPKF